jgi:tetratricopeptide (TPR) repeat protein
MLLILATAVVWLGGRDALAQGLEFESRAEALVVAEGDDPALSVQAAKTRFLCFFFAGDHERALDAAERALTLSRTAGLRYEECIHLHNVGQQCVRLDRPERARAALASSNEIARDIGVEHTRLSNEALEAFLDRQPSRLEQLASELQNRGESWHELHVRYLFGLVLAERGSAGAEAELLRALELARAHKALYFTEECEAALERIARGAP